MFFFGFGIGCDSNTAGRHWTRYIPYIYEPPLDGTAIFYSSVARNAPHSFTEDVSKPFIRTALHGPETVSAQFAMREKNGDVNREAVDEYFRPPQDQMLTLTVKHAVGPAAEHEGGNFVILWNRMKNARMRIPSVSRATDDDWSPVEHGAGLLHGRPLTHYSFINFHACLIRESDIIAINLWPTASALGKLYNHKVERSLFRRRLCGPCAHVGSMQNSLRMSYLSTMSCQNVTVGNPAPKCCIRGYLQIASEHITIPGKTDSLCSYDLSQPSPMPGSTPDG
jgi:hypothetical protein